MTQTPIRGGDVYCPNCGSNNIVINLGGRESEPFWSCDSCDAFWHWEHNGIDWVWPDDRRPGTPGCPYCGTQNYTGHARPLDRTLWYCRREACGKSWEGQFSVTRAADGSLVEVSKWKIRIPARDVPFRRTLDNPTTYPQETS